MEKKLASLKKSIEKVEWKDLTREEGYSVITANKIVSRYGEVIKLEVEVDHETRIAYLQGRFTSILTEEEVKELGSKRYRVRCTSTEGRSPDLKIWKRK